MSLLPSEEQRELEHSLRDFLSREVTPEYLRKRIASDQPSDPNLWKGLQELGLLSYFASQDADVRPGVRELGIVARESGRALLPERIVDNIFAGPFLYFQFLPPNMRALIAKTFGSSLPDAIESGGKSVGLAAVSFAKPIIVGLRNTGPLYRVSAKLPLVAYATLNNYLLFCGRAAEAAPVSLYLADLGTGKEQLVKCDATGALDLSRPYHDVQLENVAALDLGVEAASGLRNVFSTIVAEELAGMCGKVVDLTLEYVKTRKQFGVAVGSFQAVQ
ncbi:MAG: acyl-CoA dehydrogenase family protein, partial [Deltaproteobacteria bacterium]|nr:acyl-CoA dehydrogenase family protein [Deltaproteobacteria bacterium]